MYTNNICVYIYIFYIYMYICVCKYTYMYTNNMCVCVCIYIYSKQARKLVLQFIQDKILHFLIQQSQCSNVLFYLLFPCQR